MTIVALKEFAQLAALALRDITDPDATQTAADEALAALEQHVGSLGREYRPAARLVARCLWAAHGDPHRLPASTADAVLTYLRSALRWTQASVAAASLLKAGENIALARVLVDELRGGSATPRELLPLRQLLRSLTSAVEQACVELACEKMHGGGHVEAA